MANGPPSEKFSPLAQTSGYATDYGAALFDSPRGGTSPCRVPVYVARTRNNRVISSGDLYCCLLPQCEALPACRSGFPIATPVTWSPLLEESWHVYGYISKHKVPTTCYMNSARAECSQQTLLEMPLRSFMENFTNHDYCLLQSHTR